jgi:nitrate reductase molybdenum cofactor assembly chaperone NarJ/NarW
MVSTHTTQIAVYDLLAGVIGYPTPLLAEQVGECAARLAALRSRGARAMSRFHGFVVRTPIPALEELYTTTFDLKPVCYPYVGYQLFGDTYKRGEFLAHLNARYREAGFTVSGELPDHLGVILRYLARTPDGDLVAEGLVPTLKRMIDQLDGNPYRDALRAVLDVVQTQ